jgi:hypothetical protein
MSIVTTFTAEPTIFFRREHDQLCQVVRVTLACQEPLEQATLEIAGPRFTTTLAPGRFEGGQHTLDVLVPEVTEETPYQVTLYANGERHIAHVAVRPERHWELYLIHHSHLDIGYTDPQPTIIMNHLDYLDQVLALCERTASWQTPFKWTVETTLPLLKWIESRPRRTVARMVEVIQRGQVEVCAGWASLHSEAFEIDELARTFEAVGTLRNRWHIPVNTVIQTDVPGLTEGYLKCLQRLGIRTLSVAHNYAGRSLPARTGQKPDTRLFSWQTQYGQEGTDEPVLVWYTDTPHGVYMEGGFLGFLDKVEAVEAALPQRLSQLDSENYPFRSVHLRVQGSFWDNACPNIRPAQIVHEWNQRWAYPHISIATQQEFFAAIQAEAGERIPCFTGDWTDWWADGIGSAARENGMNRQAHYQLKTAEELHTLASLQTGDWEDYPAQQAEHAFQQMALFDEHTWGAANPWDNTLESNTSGDIQWRLKSGMALDAYYSSRYLLHSGLHRLADPLLAEHDEQNGAGAILCFNPTSFEQTGFVEVWLPAAADIPEPFRLVDGVTGENVPFSRIWHRFGGIDLQVDLGEGTDQWHEASDVGARPRGKTFGFVASNVPAHGYKSFLLQPEPVAVPSRAEPPADADVLENGYYRLSFDSQRGTLTSLYDKETGYECINPNAVFAFGELIYDRYTTAPKFNHLSSRITGSAAQFVGGRHRVTLAKRTGRRDTPIFSELEFTLLLEGYHQIIVTVRLYHTQKRIDWTYHLSKVTVPDKEGLYIAFPFAPGLGRPTYEITGSSASQEGPHVPGSCDYLQAIQHWLALSDGAQTVLWSPLQTPLIELGSIYTPYNPFEQTTKALEPSTVYSYALNNMWDTNFPYQQGGEITLHYSLTSYAGDFAYERAYQFGASCANPLRSLWDGRVSDRAGDALIHLGGEAASHVQLVGLRQAKQGGPTILLRLQEIAGKAGTLQLELPGVQFSQAWLADLTGAALQPLQIEGSAITVSITPGTLLTIVAETKGA